MSSKEYVDVRSLLDFLYEDECPKCGRTTYMDKDNFYATPYCVECDR